MKDRLPVEVEPLSEARWARIERNVLARVQEPAVESPPRGRAGWRPLFAGSLALATAAAAMLFVGRAVLPTRHDELAKIVTSDGGSRFTFGESTLDVAPDSTLLVRGDDEHGIGVIVDRGRVTCEVAPRHGRPPFVVNAGEVTVRVIGTRFSVVRDAASVNVTVDHGVVEVSSRGATTTLHDGESWPLAPAPPAVPELAPPVPSVATPAAEVNPPADSAKHSAPSAHPQRSHPRRPVPSAHEGAVVSSPSPATPSPQEQFEQAAQIERSRPDQAAVLYRQVTASGGPWAPNALFALGRLKAEHGETGEARRLLDRYLELYPSETNATDARGLREKLR